MEKDNWKNIKIGDIEPTKANEEVLKKLITPIKKKFDLQKIINETDTKIKTSRFDKLKGGKK